mmetsp:Transcript_56375/g.163547  ORF Transcript_56375/g.163547 Transcript_56375/m.163547 type:complete len:234 (-) Transcript_56375:674-1375(-)
MRQWELAEGRRVFGSCLHTRLTTGAAELVVSPRVVAGCARRGAMSKASLEPKRLDPAGPRCNLSGSHAPLPSEAGTNSAGFTTAFVAGVLRAQSLIESTSAVRALSKLEPDGALGAAGGAKATVLTPAAWQTACSFPMSSMTALGCEPLPMSFVPAMITARSGGAGSSASALRRPREMRPPTSSTADESRSATISCAVWPLCPQTWTSTGAFAAADNASASILPYGSYCRPAS